MKINVNSNVPDSTYFTSTDVEPRIEPDGSITIFNGEGKRRSSWGSPGVTSTIVLNEDDFCAIHVGFHHKYKGGQAWYYYYTTDGETRRIKWQQLTDEQRQRVLDSVKNVPKWAKSPGKLRSARTKPMTTYKLVEVREGHYISLYDGETEYVFGKRLGQAVGEKARREMNSYGTAISHVGGYYSHPTIERVWTLWESGNLVPNRYVKTGDRLALLECEISGTIVEYANGKLVSTYIKPLAVIMEFDYTPGAK